MLCMKLHEKLVALCRRQRLKQSDLIRVSGASKSAMSAWFKGKFKPDLVSALTMARALGVSLEYLADDSLDVEITVRDLSEDERFVLRVFRAFGIDADQAAKRMAQGTALLPTMTDADLEALLNREREREREFDGNGTTKPK